MRDSRRERRSAISVSQPVSSSVGDGEINVVEENCEYLWKSVSVWVSRERVCWRSWVQPPGVEVDMVVV